MEKPDVVAALAALAQDNRLDVFRLLVKAGPAGLAAGQVAKVLGIPPNTLSFHFDRLRQAGQMKTKTFSGEYLSTMQPPIQWSIACGNSCSRTFEGGSFSSTSDIP